MSQAIDPHAAIGKMEDADATISKKRQILFRLSSPAHKRR